jgi:hypothetical protein
MHLLPYDCGGLGNREANVVDLLAGATKDALCALLECATSTRGTSIMPETLYHLLLQTIATSIPNLKTSTRTTTSGVGPYECYRSELLCGGRQ